MEYKELENVYKNGKLVLQKTIELNESTYRLYETTDNSLSELMNGEEDGLVVYVTEGASPEYLVFVLQGLTVTDMVPITEAELKSSKKEPSTAGIKSDIMKDVKRHLETATHKSDNTREKLLKDVEKMIDKHQKEMNTMKDDHESKMKDLEDHYEKLLKSHTDAIEGVRSTHQTGLADLRKAFDDLRQTHDKRIEQMRQDHDDHKKRVKSDHDEHVTKILDDHDGKFFKMKRDHGEKIRLMKQTHLDKVNGLTKGHEDKFAKHVKQHEENQEQMTLKHQDEIGKMEEGKIGVEAHVEILNLHTSPPLLGKVDTGATICSLHADKLEVKGDTVRFINKDLSSHVITVPKSSQSAVRSADGGISYRPVVLLNLRIKGKDIPQVEVNLNDREHMTHPFLIGHNALVKGKFVIDPNIVGEGEDAININILEESEED